MAAEFSPAPTSRLSLVPASNPKDPAPDIASRPAQMHPKVAALVKIAGERCSAYLAEAAVLVLVFGILDFFLQRGHIELAWVAGALGISVALLAASVGTDFTARRWLGAHP